MCAEDQEVPWTEQRSQNYQVQVAVDWKFSVAFQHETIWCKQGNNSPKEELWEGLMQQEATDSD